MATIPKPFIDSLLARCDIVETIDARVPLRKKGQNFVACCPFHQESTPSFTVTPEKQFYYCFGCNAGGNAISFVMAYEHLNFIEAVEALASRCGLTVPREGGRAVPQPVIDGHALLARVGQFYREQLQRAPEAQAYLAQRGITQALSEHFSLGFAPNGWDTLLKWGKSSSSYPPARLAEAGLLAQKNTGGYYDRFRNRILFPIRDRRGRYIGFGGRALPGGAPKYLNSPETPFFHKGRELYGLYEACQQSRPLLARIFVVEGYLDVLALAQHGIPNTVATLGTATTRTHLERLFSLTQEVVFCFDGDAAGQRAAWRALETSLPILQDGWSLRFLFLPDGEDPDTWVRQQGGAAFSEWSRTAKSFSDFLFDALCRPLEMASPEGKARLARLATPLLRQLPVGVMRTQLFDRLARQVGLSAEILQQPSRRPISSPVQPALRVQYKLVERALALLLHRPHLAQRFQTPLTALCQEAALDFPLLVALVAVLQQQPDATTGSLLEHFRAQSAYYEQLSQLAAYQWRIPEAGLQQEMSDTLTSLKKAVIEREVEQLLQKARQKGLSEREKQALHQLITMGKSSASNI